ncbi:MAG: hypothetical protein LBN08_02305 [Lactobacillales bacterium]|nr:hypothetical protein [Lactobacillales bacterium]
MKNLIIGIGGAGRNIVERLNVGFDKIIVDSDEDSLNQSPISDKFFAEKI